MLDKQFLLRHKDIMINGDLRKKKIPLYIWALALSRMIKMKMPVTEGLDKEDEKSVDDVVW